MRHQPTNHENVAKSEAPASRDYSSEHVWLNPNKDTHTLTRLQWLEELTKDYAAKYSDDNGS
jgi:hypothetical protein